MEAFWEDYTHFLSREATRWEGPAEHYVYLDFERVRSSYVRIVPPASALYQGWID